MLNDLSTGHIWTGDEGGHAVVITGYNLPPKSTK